jgi:hypothetical protein
MNRRLSLLAGITLIGFPLLGWVILRFYEPDPWAVMTRSSQLLWMQILLGSFVGLLLGFGARFIVSRPFMRDVGHKYGKLVQQLGLSIPGIWALSFCAGFGEELLFRGALQPLLGIWLTAIIFVAIHGYLNPWNLKLSVYGIFMTLAIGLLGYLTEYSGIWAAAIAHMWIDVVLFYYLLSIPDDYE